MAKIMQNLVVLMDPSEYANEISLKAGNMCFNRFCIDEDAAFELSGIYQLEAYFTEDCKIMDSAFQKIVESDAKDLNTHIIYAGFYSYGIIGEDL